MPDDISILVKRALAEDIGSGDITAELIDAQQTASAHVICREPAVLCGTPWFDEVFRQIGGETHINWHCRDAERIKENQLLCELHGNARALLSAERSALNFLQTLSAVATQTAAYVDALGDCACKILDTRKTIPGLRSAEKYAVRCGGGHNHRHGLFDAILIKENHISAAGSIAQAITAARKVNNAVVLVVEVETLDQLQLAIDEKPDRILLDNMPLEQLRQAVALNAGRVELEVSGGIALDKVRPIAETGVDYISVGAITKNVNAIDLSMRFK